ncbi:uncharacterized protein STEHIDRAFT_111902 [Stereum hirsutum FP-91666 SS1]|uniref:uncharacterized protein n=1 Tax=Stereum hirsutum (strain FP-91666) TaxID=721885 RepID=UPI00044497A6|nr:uncharacterized protein STEHIDRAFT_111902 [Stereum hirsutum FP-91666 SS1]EIM85297.1 hypothetical protein STEHIDRAFT_111902 [Stereum hirsutum FP-91666 SS1]
MGIFVSLDSQNEYYEKIYIITGIPPPPPPPPPPLSSKAHPSIQSDHNTDIPTPTPTIATPQLHIPIRNPNAPESSSEVPEPEPESEELRVLDIPDPWLSITSFVP